MIFVTGGTGLIGSHLLYELARKGEKIRALKRSDSNLNKVDKVFSYYSRDYEKLLSQIEWIEGDLLEDISDDRYLSGISEIYHCAAIISFRSSDRSRIIQANRDTTANIVDAALNRGIKKFCHVSSVAALGTESEGGVTKEDSGRDSLKARTAYAESKFFSEAEIWRGIEEGLQAVIVNPSIVLGPGNINESSTQLFKAVAGRLKFYPAGGTGFVDVRDVVTAMVLLMGENYFDSAKNERYILNGANLTYQQLFNKIAHSLNIAPPRYYASPLLLEIARYAASLISLFSGQPTGITRETVNSAKQITKFDGSKISDVIPFQYRNIDQTIHDTVQLLGSDLHHKH